MTLLPPPDNDADNDKAVRESAHAAESPALTDHDAELSASSEHHDHPTEPEIEMNSTEVGAD